MKIKDGDLWGRITFLSILIATYLCCTLQIAWAVSIFGTRISLEIGAAAIGVSLDTGNRPLRWEGIRLAKTHSFNGFSSLPDFWIVDGFRGKEFNLILPVWILIVIFLTAVSVIKYRKKNGNLISVQYRHLGS